MAGQPKDLIYHIHLLHYKTYREEEMSINAETITATTRITPATCCKDQHY